MDKYLKNFDTHSDYNTYTQSANFTRPNVSVCTQQKEVHYNPKDYSKKYLTFRALEDGTFSFSTNNIQYSLNNGNTWSTLTAGNNTPTVTKGNKILWKASGLTADIDNGIGTFSSTGKFNIEGNIMSLVDGDNFINSMTLSSFQFYKLFNACANLISAKHLVLPATTLNQKCYSSMFYNCTSLIKAPELPAIILVNNCYEYMFSGCTALTTAPVLPATTLATSCYYNMFWKCTSLMTAPELPATTLNSLCYYRMFYGCTSLIIAPTLPATTLASDCYNSMFYGCTSLTTAPELPATTLANFCYYRMFYQCTNLNSITCLATDISASNCLSSWVRNVASSGTFTKAASMTGWPAGENGIPDGWTVVNAS